MTFMRINQLFFYNMDLLDQVLYGLQICPISQQVFLRGIFLKHWLINISETCFHQVSMKILHHFYLGTMTVSGMKRFCQGIMGKAWNNDLGNNILCCDNIKKNN